MKKSNIVKLVLVSTLALTGCSGKKESPKQDGYTVHGWSNSDDTVSTARVHHGTFLPYYFYYSRFGLYSEGPYHEAMRSINRGTRSNPQFHSIRSLSNPSSFSAREGFGHISAGRTAVS